MSKHDLEKLINSCISSKVDYCNGPFTRLPEKTIKQLQLIKHKKKSPHYPKLDWLPVSHRIDLKALLLVYKSLNGTGPNDLSDMFQQYTPVRPPRSLGRNLFLPSQLNTVKQPLATILLSSGINFKMTSIVCVCLCVCMSVCV